MRGHRLTPLSIAPHPDGGWSLRIEDSVEGRRLAADLMHSAFGAARMLVVPDIAGTRDAIEPLGDWPDPFGGPVCAECGGMAMVAVEVPGGLGDAPCPACPEGRAWDEKLFGARRRRKAQDGIRPAVL